MGTGELLLALAPGLPAAVAVLWLFPRARGGLVALAPWAAVPALLLALLPGAPGTTLAVPTLFTGLHLEVDDVGRAFLLLTALLWVAAGAFARSYHRDDEGREGFFGFFALTMTGNLGLVLAGDILSFYLFFALMTFAGYGLVIHNRDGTAFRAGRIYIVMAVLGELCLLAALFTLGWSFGGIPAFGFDLDLAWEGLIGEGRAGVVAILVAGGFGVKAGLAPLHLWLPLAHPVAPTAASALLSGAMIKAGLLAWLRFLPMDAGLPGLGLLLVVLGVGAAFYGVVVGLAQDDPKTILAYSSVSQMGYMALGTGLLLLTPDRPGTALVAVVLYALHHGVAKGALFLSVGVADRTGAGSDRVWPRLLLILAALPALALAGAPLTTGVLAKGALKEVLPGLVPAWYPVLDPLLLVAALGTTLLLARFLVRLRGRMGGGEEEVPWGLVVPWGLLVLAGVLGPLWHPLAYPVPEGVELPGVTHDLASAAWPVVVGAVLAWMIWRRPRILGPLAGFRLPAGDLVVPLERGARWAGSRPVRRVLEGSLGGAARLRRTQVWSHARAAWLAERDLFLARGPVVGVMIFVLALGIVAALLLS